MAVFVRAYVLPVDFLGCTAVVFFAGLAPAEFRFYGFLVLERQMLLGQLVTLVAVQLRWIQGLLLLHCGQQFAYATA